MTENEEMIYSLMGFNPILLLDKPPLYENYRVNIIRPGNGGEDRKEKNKILEDTQQKIVDNYDSKHQQNNKDIIRLKNKNPNEKESSNSEENENIGAENINLDLDKEINELINSNFNSINEKDELNSTESEEVNEDPRRKRRRSSAS